MNSVGTEDRVLPGAWLGMLGGGQLGRMFCHAAQAMGYRVIVLDPDAQSPAGAVADQHLRRAYNDAHGLDILAQRCRAVSTEFENIPAESLARLKAHISTRPAAEPVAITQDRIQEKSFCRKVGVPIAPYIEVKTIDDLLNADRRLFPGILKAARFGYDGKGQARVANAHEAIDAYNEFGAVHCVLEARLSLNTEVSIVLARDAHGNVAAYPPIENTHRDGILAVSRAHALEDQPQLAARAYELARTIATGLSYVGVLCVELFVLDDDELIVNEIAPRPHNSGHYTIDACATSQFEQQVRALAGMPLGSPDSDHYAIMLNLLGDVWFTQDGKMQEPDWAAVLAIKGAKLHLYGKHEVRRGRKMGHVTVVAATRQEVEHRASEVASVLSLEANAVA